MFLLLAEDQCLLSRRLHCQLHFVVFSARGGRNTARCVRSSPIPTLPPVCLSVRFLSFLLRMAVHILSGVSSSPIQSKPKSKSHKNSSFALPPPPPLFFRKSFWDTEPISRICHLGLRSIGVPGVRGCNLIQDGCPIFHVPPINPHSIQNADCYKKQNIINKYVRRTPCFRQADRVSHTVGTAGKERKDRDPPFPSLPWRTQHGL